MESTFSKIQKIINEWEKSSPEAREKFINDYSNKPEVLNKQIEHLNNIVNALKNGTEEDIALFRENESVLNKYEDILLNQIYAENDRSKIILQRYFAAIDELVISKINSADSSSQDTPQTTSGPTQAEPQPSPPLDATGMEELNKIFGELNFK